MGTGSGARRARRAPRLGSEESIGGLFTRTGRFADIDPTRSRALPRWPQVVGVLAWLAFTAGVGVAAWRRHRPDSQDGHAGGTAR